MFKYGFDPLVAPLCFFKLFHSLRFFTHQVLLIFLALLATTLGRLLGGWWQTPPTARIRAVSDAVQGLCSLLFSIGNINCRRQISVSHMRTLTSLSAAEKYLSCPRANWQLRFPLIIWLCLRKTTRCRSEHIKTWFKLCFLINLPSNQATGCLVTSILSRQLHFQDYWTHSRESTVWKQKKRKN